VKSRIIASLAAAGAVLLTATGCGLIDQQATTIEYTASDGVNLPHTETPGLDVRNAFVVADADGRQGNFIAVLANNTEADQTLGLDWEGGSASITVKAGDTLSLGAKDAPELLDNIDSIPGSTLVVYAQPGDSDGVEINLPVLNNCLTEYSDLAPNDVYDAEACEPVSMVSGHGEE
jgi:hypothetical protein